MSASGHGASIRRLPGRLPWLLDRLRCMSLPEVCHRAGRMASTGIERLRRPVLTPGDPAVPAARWIGELPRDRASSGARIYEAHARAVGGGGFGHAQRPPEPHPWPRWNRDPVTGIELPMRHGPSMRLRGYGAGFDIKNLWEPNRHQHWMALAQAWVATRAPWPAEELRAQLRSWLDECPYPLGPNWSSALEAALRLISWSLVFQWTGGWCGMLFDEADRPVRREVFARAVHGHLRFVGGRLSAWSSANNHLIGELAGLLVGAITWPNWPQCAEWREMALAGLEREALRQNAPDGVNREQAMSYQGFVLELLLLAGLAARAAGDGFSPGYWQRLEAMAEYLAAMTDAGGVRPATGDSDDAIAMWPGPLGRNQAGRALLALCAVEFGRADFKAAALAGIEALPPGAAARVIDPACWLLGEAAAARFERLPVVPAAPRRREFPSGGWYVLGSDLGTSREVRVQFDAADLGYLSIAAHGHADALSLLLSIAGRAVLVDAGTFCYNTEPHWRAYFRGTAAHNTVRIDHLDQSVAGGPFMWTRKAVVSARGLASQANGQRAGAEHDGYRRLADPVRHRRTVTVSGRLEAQAHGETASRIEVEDLVDCAGPHEVELFWHFAPDCVLVREDGSNGRRVRATLDDRLEILVELDLPPGFSLELLRGDEDRPAGWYSPRFGVRVPSWVAVASGSIDGTTVLATQFLPVLR